MGVHPASLAHWVRLDAQGAETKGPEMVTLLFSLQNEFAVPVRCLGYGTLAHSRAGTCILLKGNPVLGANTERHGMVFRSHSAQGREVPTTTQG